MKRYIVIVGILLSLLFLLIPVVYGQNNTNITSSEELWKMISQASSNPKVLIAFVIQVVMGLGLGYVSVKVAKYIFAFIGILILGAVLSVWSLGGSVEGFIVSIGSQAQQFIPYIKNLLTMLGILTVAPVTIGFIIGFLIGLKK